MCVHLHLNNKLSACVSNQIAGAKICWLAGLLGDWARSELSFFTLASIKPDNSIDFCGFGLNLKLLWSKVRAPSFPFIALKTRVLDIVELEGASSFARTRSVLKQRARMN